MGIKGPQHRAKPGIAAFIAITGARIVAINVIWSWDCPILAWENAYDKGRWSDALAVAALERVRRERQRAKAARAAEKKEKDAQRTADKRKNAAARRREAKAQASAEK